MKFLKDFVKKNEGQFHPGGKLEKWFPVWDGLATFLFVPDLVTNKGAHIRDAVDLKRTMNTVIMALLPCLLFGIWNVGYQHDVALGRTEIDVLNQFLFGLTPVLPMLMVSYGVGLGVEFIFCIINKLKISFCVLEIFIWFS